MSDSCAAPYRPGDILRHPLVLCMLVLWLLNDHLFKDLFGNALTGKLSDVAGLAVFPLLPYALYEMLCGRLGHPARHGLWVLMVSILATGVVFGGINLF